MANNSIANTVTLTGALQRLVGESTVFTFRLTAGIDNAGKVTVVTAGGSYALPPGARSEEYRHCDLHDIQVQGAAGDTIIYDGGTW